MRRADLLGLIGSIWLGLGIANNKIVLSIGGLIALVLAIQERRRGGDTQDGGAEQ